MEEICDRLPRRRIKIFLGDFNAKIGRKIMYTGFVWKVMSLIILWRDYAIQNGSTG